MAPEPVGCHDLASKLYSPHHVKSQWHSASVMTTRADSFTAARKVRNRHSPSVRTRRPGVPAWGLKGSPENSLQNIACVESSSSNTASRKSAVAPSSNLRVQRYHREPDLPSLSDPRSVFKRN